MEEALGDRLSFRRFVGLGLEDGTPDHSTISRLRHALEVQELSAPLFTEVAAGRGARSATDPEAAWTQTGRGGRSHFGCKVHLGVDADTGVVRRAALTPANVYESEVADALVSEDEQAVYGDRAYESNRRRQWLRAQGINDRIVHRPPTSISGPSPTGSGATPSARPAGRWWRRSSARSSAAMATSGSATAAWGATPWRCGSSSWPTTFAKRAPWPGAPPDPGRGAPRAGVISAPARRWRRAGAAAPAPAPRRQPSPRAIPQLFKGLHAWR